MRRSKDFVLAVPTSLNDHFPSTKQIVFASDITTDLRGGAKSLVRRLRENIGSVVDLDEGLWEEAKRRVTGITDNTPLSFTDLMATIGFDSQVCDEVGISEVELDALRLTLHGRERLLFLKSIAQSELSQYLRVIGESWKAIPEIRPFVIETRRFPVGQLVSDLQRSRVCPDFGSSLGQMPYYYRAQTLGGRAIGLIQRRHPQGNPLLDGLPSYRCFSTADDLLRSCHIMLNNDDIQLLQEEAIIRSNYVKRQLNDRLEMKELIRSLDTARSSE